MTEQRMWRVIRELWKGHGVRIEASWGEAVVGTPDCNLSIGQRGGWVELKVWPEPLRDSQRPWHAEALTRGATCVVIAWVKGKWWIGEWWRYEQLGDCPLGNSLDEVLIEYELRLAGRVANHATPV